jgi:NAD(P)-dependent dehydrogenase (short-subunit alcohol dehydrogenase family)
VQVQYCDVARPEDHALLLARVQALAGTSETQTVNLINNAAIFPRAYTPQNFASIVQTNLVYADTVRMCEGWASTHAILSLSLYVYMYASVCASVQHAVGACVCVFVRMRARVP